MKKTTNVLFVSMFTNAFLVLVKIIIGFIGKSGTLIADGIHSLSDLTTDIVAIVGNKISKKPADNDHPYGHGQLQYLTSIIVGVVIFILGISLIINSFSKEINTPSIIVLYVSILTIVIKWCLSSYILRLGKKKNNSILIASGTESRADALTSIFVIISYLFTKLTKYCELFKYADNFFTILIGAYIIIVGFLILKENVLNIIGKKETDTEYLNKLENIVKENNEIIGLTDFTIMKYGTYNIANIEIELNSNLNLREVENITTELKSKMLTKENRIMHVKISVKSKEVE